MLKRFASHLQSSRRLPVLLFAILLVGLGGIPASTLADDGPTARDVPALPDNVIRKHAVETPPGLESQLAQMVQARERGEGVPEAMAGLLSADDRVQLIAYCDESEFEGVVAELKALDVEVEATWRGQIQCLAPIESLDDMAVITGVFKVSRPPRWFEHATTEALGLINADEWHSVGLDGEGVKVGILDGGFAGYTSLLGTELPASVATYFPTGVGTSSHGTACAELIHDVAPAASLYFATFTNSTNWHDAATWLVGQGVDVISCSMGWLGTGPRDGTSSICDPIEDARQAGILWSQSAGNDALKHWGGRFRDSNSNLWHEFATSPATDWNAVWLDAGTYVDIYLTWDDPWGSSTNDYDMYLYYEEDTEPCAWSENDQVGGYPDPIEVIQGTAPSTGWYFIQVYEWATTSDRVLDLICRPDNDEPLYFYTQAGSIHDEGTSSDCMTVGAVDWANPNTLEYYSSRGPTGDGRTKPDISGPARVSTSTYGAGDFAGTSAATPHVAGAAALVKQAYPSYDADDIQDYLESHAVDLGSGGKDNLYGSGRVLLPNPPPTLDFGDAPDPHYPTLLASDGARHFVVSGLHLGSAVDKEYDGQPNATATGDDLIATDDEDGVVFLTDLMAGEDATVRITVSQAAKVDAWIDYNDDGDWDDGDEHVLDSLSLTAGTHDLVASVPLTATPTDSTFARFRLSSSGGLDPSGLASDGEVEDYEVAILPAPPDPPTDLTGFAYHNTAVSLEWLQGLASDETIVVRKQGSYPASTTDGTVVYSGSDTSCIDDGLSPKTDYYYSAWSYASATGLHSTSAAQLMVTTLPAEASWTFMVYLDGDNDLEAAAELDVAEMQNVGSTPDVNIVLQTDRYTTPGCWREYILSGDSFLLASAPELNMADPANLTDFVDWATTQYPAQKYALVLWDHGSGCIELPAPEGIIYDDSQLDWMTMSELAEGLDGTSAHIDALGFDACLMQMAEVCYEVSLISDPPDVVVGSEGTVPGEGWAYDGVLDYLTSTPSSSAPALATEIVDEYMLEYPPSWNLTMSGVELPTSSQMQTTLDNLSRALIISDYPTEILTARAAAQSYDDTDYRDLVHFCELIVASAPDCITEAQAVIDFVASSVVAEAHTTGTGVDDSHGLSIYLPATPAEYDPDYDQLSLSAHTWWDDFLRGGYDFGDAPDPTYPTLLASNGARHAMSSLYLGREIDAEIDGQASALATGDDTLLLDDEDGVEFTSSLVPGELVSLVVTSSGTGLLDAWVDFNDNGSWSDAGEQVFASLALVAGPNALEFAVPGDATYTNSTFARCRVSSAGGLTPNGAASDGEVEDYEVGIVETAQLSLETGWNMVSVPLQAGDMSVQAIFPSADAVYTWEPGSKSYAVPTTIAPRKSYWVAISSASTLDVQGVPVESWTQDISTGWNMTGSLYGCTPSIADPDDTPDASVEGFAYTWDPLTKSYVYTTNIETGKGYWMAATADCSLTLAPPP